MVIVMTVADVALMVTEMIAVHAVMVVREVIVVGIATVRISLRSQFEKREWRALIAMTSW